MPKSKLQLGIKLCHYCNKSIKLKIRRDLERKKYCSHKCRQLWLVKNDPRYLKNLLELAVPASMTSECSKKKSNPGSKNGRFKKDRNLVKTRSKYELSIWRKQVFERDNYTCQVCFQYGGKLNADHIKPYCLYPELREDINNGRTLCISCHKKTDTYGSKVWKYKKELKHV